MRGRSCVGRSRASRAPPPSRSTTPPTPWAVTGAIAPKEVLAAVERSGIAAEPWTDERESRRLLAVLTAISGAALLAILLGGPPGPLSSLAVAAGFSYMVPRAGAGALGLREWTEAGSVAFLYSLALALEAGSVGRARRAVEKLLDVAPATATLVAPERRVPAEGVDPGLRATHHICLIA